MGILVTSGFALDHLGRMVYCQYSIGLVQYRDPRTWWLSLLASRAILTPSKIWVISFWGIWSIRKTRLRHATDFWISFPFKSFRFRSCGERFGSIENFRNSSSDFSAVRLFWIFEKFQALSPANHFGWGTAHKKFTQSHRSFWCICSFSAPLLPFSLKLNPKKT